MLCKSDKPSIIIIISLACGPPLIGYGHCKSQSHFLRAGEQQRCPQDTAVHRFMLEGMGFFFIYDDDDGDEGLISIPPNHRDTFYLGPAPWQAPCPCPCQPLYLLSAAPCLRSSLPRPLQFLESYKSVTMESMAAAFDCSVGFLDTEISDFIVAGRLNAMIDKVAGIIETNRCAGGGVSASIQHGPLGYKKSP